MSFHEKATAAYHAGYAAARSAAPRRNPYDGNAPTALERQLAQMWARGYSAGNPMNELMDEGPPSVRGRAR